MLNNRTPIREVEFGFEKMEREEEELKETITMLVLVVTLIGIIALCIFVAGKVFHV